MATKGKSAKQKLDPAVERLRALIQIPTVSSRDPESVDAAAFELLLTTMREQWPLLHSLDVTRIDTYGLLIHWPGAAADKPIVLMAHLDVVPVVAEDWTNDPFSAEVIDGSIWGRGTLDDKGCAAGICEAVESLLADGFVPAQDVWLSFGCDEEVFGTSAQAAVAELVRRGVEPWLVLDEGGAIAHDGFPGIAPPIGVIGVTEKGSTDLELSVTGGGGHASTPSKLGPTARLARAITRLDNSSMRASVPAPTVELLRRIAPEAPLPLRPLLTNAAPLQPLLARALAAAGPEPAAMTRTTFAVTMLSGSPQLNVIAARASAGVNVRVMVGDSVEDVVNHVRKTIDDDKVAIDIIAAGEASPISPFNTANSSDEGFALVEDTIAEIYPDAIATPYVMMAATDSRHFTAISPRVYRFAPFRMTKHQREAIHAANEFIGIEDYLDGVRWYRRFIEGLPK